MDSNIDIYIGKACSETRKSSTDKWDTIAKPLGSLGELENIVSDICAARGMINPKIDKRCLVVFCADNGVVEEGVTQIGSEVTGIVAKNLCNGSACVCKMADIAKTDVIAVDMGMKKAVNDKRIIDMRISAGTENMTRRRAMTRCEAVKAVNCGIEMAKYASNKGYNLLATGEMGIGNTTTATAIASVLLGRDVREMTGKGAGLSQEGLERKIGAIEAAIRKNEPDPTDPIDVLSKVGGFDIAAMTGFFLGSASCRLPCIIDGFISSVAALCATRLHPETIAYMIPSHISGEPASKTVLCELGLKPVISAGMRLGEGSGAVALIPVLDMVMAIYDEVETFEDIKMEKYERL